MRAPFLGITIATSLLMVQIGCSSTDSEWQIHSTIARGWGGHTALVIDSKGRFASEVDDRSLEFPRCRQLSRTERGQLEELVQAAIDRYGPNGYANYGRCADVDTYRTRINWIMPNRDDDGYRTLWLRFNQCSENVDLIVRNFHELLWGIDERSDRPCVRRGLL